MYGRATVGMFSEKPQLPLCNLFTVSVMITSRAAGVSGLPGRTLLASNVPAGTSCSMNGRSLYTRPIQLCKGSRSRNRSVKQSLPLRLQSLCIRRIYHLIKLFHPLCRHLCCWRTMYFWCYSWCPWYVHCKCHTGMALYMCSTAMCSTAHNIVFEKYIC